MAGEIVGLDGISNAKHACDTTALEDTEVCVIPYRRIDDIATQVPALRNHFHRVMSREIVREHGVMLLLGTMLAEERMATFLLNLSQRFAARGYSTSEFVLRMTRAEIGSFLGLKLETVSRVLSRFTRRSRRCCSHCCCGGAAPRRTQCSTPSTLRDATKLTIVVVQLSTDELCRRYL